MAWSTLVWSSFVFKQVTGSGKSGRGRLRKQEKEVEKSHLAASWWLE